MRRQRLRLWAVGLIMAVLALSGCAGPREVPAPRTVAGGVVAGEVFLGRAGPEVTPAIFDLPGGAWREARISLRNTSYRDTKAALRCDGSARIVAGGESLYLRPGGRQIVTLAGRPARAATLVLTSDVTTCDIDWGEGHRLWLQRAEIGAPRLAQVDRSHRRCATTAPNDALARAFFDGDGLSQTCAAPTPAIRVVQKPVDALAARLSALTGREGTCPAVYTNDPDYKLDFSNAPKLDLIILASLHIRADFCGAMVRQALEYHAARGTRVRILVSDVLQKDKDRDYWNDLAARFPNVQIQYYRWTPRGAGGPLAELRAAHRVTHVKLFLALARDPDRSRLILGGRNLHDGFFFERPTPFVGHPELRDFDAEGREGLAWFAAFEDIDIVTDDHETISAIASHFSTLWNRDAAGIVPRAAAVVERANAPTGQGVVRHFLSAPWADGRALERRYVEVIDAARRDITIVSPFLYPPRAIDAALVRAAQRGVRVRLISRLDSTEPSAAITRALATLYMNKRYDLFEIYDLVPAPRMVHTKLLVVDGRLGISSSVNMNARSFGQDTENGLMFLDGDMAARLGDVAEAYRIRARRIDRPMTEGVVEHLLAAFPELWQVF